MQWILTAMLAATTATPPNTKLLHEFMAPCCWQQRLDEHDSPLAAQVRQQINDWSAAGWTEEQIRKRLISEFGVCILPEPEGAKAVALYGAPLLVMVTGGGSVLFFLIASRKQEKASPIGPDTAPEMEIDE